MVQLFWIWVLDYFIFSFLFPSHPSLVYKQLFNNWKAVHKLFCKEEKAQQRAHFYYRLFVFSYRFSAGRHIPAGSIHPSLTGVNWLSHWLQWNNADLCQLRIWPCVSECHACTAREQSIWLYLSFKRTGQRLCLILIDFITLMTVQMF